MRNHTSCWLRGCAGADSLELAGGGHNVVASDIEVE